jgi:hypothetical protein
LGDGRERPADESAGNVSEARHSEGTRRAVLTLDLGYYLIILRVRAGL